MAYIFHENEMPKMQSVDPGRERIPFVNKDLAPIYGLAASLPVRGAVADLIRRYVDLLYET